jgi:hypothetical protein
MILFNEAPRLSVDAQRRKFPLWPSAVLLVWDKRWRDRLVCLSSVSLVTGGWTLNDTGLFSFWSYRLILPEVSMQLKSGFTTFLTKAIHPKTNLLCISLKSRLELIKCFLYKCYASLYLTNENSSHTLPVCEHGNEPSGFIKRGGGISWLAEQMLASQEGLNSGYCNVTDIYYLHQNISNIKSTRCVIKQYTNTFVLFLVCLTALSVAQAI